MKHEHEERSCAGMAFVVGIGVVLFSIVMLVSGLAIAEAIESLGGSQ